MLKDKVLVVAVTYNNPILLDYAFQSYQKYDTGYDCDFLIVDHESTDDKHKKVLDRLSKKHAIETYENNRVEVSFNKAYLNNKDYKYYFFVHDDAIANRPNWLKAFIDRVNSQHVESIVQGSSWESLPVGRVGAQHQPWRSYSTILGHPVQCLFLEEFAKVYTGQDCPTMFKHADPDRCLVTNECLAATNGVINLSDFKLMKDKDPDKYKTLCDILNRFLQYPDEGIPPRDIYPAGECWNKFTMATEFLNSLVPLMKGYRTVGLEGDGFLEQVHGFDVPFGSNYIAHFGQPNVVEFFAKKFNTDAVEVRKKYNDKTFLMKCDMLIKQYYKE